MPVRRILMEWRGAYDGARGSATPGKKADLPGLSAPVRSAPIRH